MKVVQHPQQNMKTLKLKMPDSPIKSQESTTTRTPKVIPNNKTNSPIVL